MAPIMKVTTQWTGFIGAPGYSNFYFRDDAPEASWDAGANASTAAVRTFFDSIKQYFPDHLVWKFGTDVPKIEETTGELLDILPGGTHLDVRGTSIDTQYSAASGLVVNWRSGGVRSGRRVRGRTFLVPAATTGYALDGSVQPSALTAITTAATSLVNLAGGQHLGVWARPTDATAERPAQTGQWFPAISANMPSKVAILKSRRD